MQPSRIGRILGIGARVAGEKLSNGIDRLGTAQPGAMSAAAGTAAAAPPRTVQGSPTAGSRASSSPVSSSPVSAGPISAQSVATPAAAAPRSAMPSSVPRIDAGQAAGHSRRLARGAGRFGAAFFRPFAHATSILWNQIAGLFFTLFALFFIEHSWEIYKASHGRDRHLVVYVAMAVVFVWFAVSSFWRARSRQRRS